MNTTLRLFKVRHVLREQQELGLVDCSGRGAAATWSRGTGKGNQLPSNKGNDEGNGAPSKAKDHDE